MFKRIKNFYLRHIKHLSIMEINILNWRKRGVTIGDNCHIYSNLPTTRDCFLLKIHNNVTVSGKCTFLLHDSSIGNVTDGKLTDLLGEVEISDNCFIGYSSIILPGVFLAKGVIVGAGSVVTKSFTEPNIIIAGNPAKKIGEIKSFLEKYGKNGFNLNNLSQREIQELVEKQSNMLIKK